MITVSIWQAMLIILFLFKSVLQFPAIALHNFQKYSVWGKKKTKNGLGDILQLEWHQRVRLPKPNSLPSKFKFERHPAVGAQSYNQTSQRFHNNLKTQPGRWMESCRCRASGACGGRCHRASGGISSSDSCWRPDSTDLASSRPVLLHVLWRAAMCLRRIMHWARRIEQEIDRVFQHITGAQQLKGVSASLCFLEIALMSAPDQPIKTRSGHEASGTSAKPRSRRAQIGARCEKQLVYFRTSWQTVTQSQLFFPGRLKTNTPTNIFYTNSFLPG